MSVPLERVIYSDQLIKLNRKGKAQKRYTTLTALTITTTRAAHHHPMHAQHPMSLTTLLDACVYICMCVCAGVGVWCGSVLMMTDRAIYNFESGKYRSYKRRILIPHLSSLSISSDNADTFVLHVHHDYDYHYVAPSRNEFLHLVGVQYKLLCDDNLTAHIRENAEIDSIIVTKTKLNEQKQVMQGAGAAKGGGGGGGGTLTNKIRQLVSKKKVRWQQDGFDLVHTNTHCGTYTTHTYAHTHIHHAHLLTIRASIVAIACSSCICIAVVG